MENNIQDTYFDTFDEAFEVASQQNIFGPYQNLQICYYDGEKKDTDCKNLIHLPLSNFVDELLRLNTRIPTRIVSGQSNTVKKKIEQFTQVKYKVLNYNKKQIKKIQLNFHEKYRVYLSADYGGKVVFKTYELLKKIFESKNFIVYFDVNDNLTNMDDLGRTTAIMNFKPHIILNINRLRNDYLHDECFNFCWFMDPTLMLFDDTEIKLRNRDYIFYLGDEVYNALIKKRIPKNKIFHQFLTPDYEIFCEKKEIKKENKIIFIGQNYFEVVSPTIEYKNHPVRDEIRVLFNENGLTKIKLKELADKYASTLRREEHLEIFIVPAVAREEMVKWMCKQTVIPAEVYGSGWDNIFGVASHVERYIEDENELIEVVNSAKYSLIPHSNFIYVSKLFESCSCGAIPIVYKGETTLDNFDIYVDNALIFSTEQEFINLLNKKSLKSPKKISDDISLVQICDKINEIIDKEISR